MPSLLVEIDNTSYVFHLPEGMPVFVGRAHECDIHLSAPGVSRRHAVFIARDGICGVKDLNSFNGTFVNGKQILQPCALADGDRVKISSFTFRFNASRPAAASRRARPVARKDDKPSSELRLPRAMLVESDSVPVQSLFADIDNMPVRRGVGVTVRMLSREHTTFLESPPKRRDNPQDVPIE